MHTFSPALTIKESSISPVDSCSLPRDPGSLYRPRLGRKCPMYARKNTLLRSENCHTRYPTSNVVFISRSFAITLPVGHAGSPDFNPNLNPTSNLRLLAQIFPALKCVDGPFTVAYASVFYISFLLPTNMSDVLDLQELWLTNLLLLGFDLPAQEKKYKMHFSR